MGIRCEERSEQWAVGSEQWAVSGEQWAGRKADESRIQITRALRQAGAPPRYEPT
jgi:hypothetical protein